MDIPLDDVSPIGAIAEKYGVTLRALRFYEEKGLVTPIRIGNHRLYNRTSEDQLKKLLEAKRLGYSIRMIQTKIPLSRWDLTKNVNDDLLRERLVKLRREEREIKTTIRKIEEILQER